MQPALLDTTDTDGTGPIVSAGSPDTSSPTRPKPRPSGVFRRTDLDRALSVASLPAAVASAALSVVHRLQLWMEAAVYPYDAYYYMGTASNLAYGNGYAFRGTAHTRFLPGYPIAMAPLVKDLGAEAAGVLVASISWALLALVCYFMARNLAGWLAGLSASVLVSFQPVAIEWTSLPMAEGLFTLAAFSSLWAMTTALEKENPTALVPAGLLGGYALITRSEGFALVPIYLGTSAYALAKARRRTQRGRSWPGTPLLGAGGGLLALLLPYSSWLVWSAGKKSAEISHASEFLANFRWALRDLVPNFGYYMWGAYRQPLFAALGYVGLVWILARRPRAGTLLGLWLASMVGFHSAWYYRYDRFAVAAIPAMGVAAGAAVGWVGSLGAHARELTSRRRKFSRSYLTAGLLASIAAAALTFADDGKSLARLHMTLLNRAGGRAILMASEAAGRLEGGLASNVGAMAEFHAGKPVATILARPAEAELANVDPRDLPCVLMAACFDPDRLESEDPEARLEALRRSGVRYLVLHVDEASPEDVVRRLGLPPGAVQLRADVVGGGPSEAGVHRASILEVLP